MGTRIRLAEIADAAAVGAIYAPFVTDSATSFEAVVPAVVEIEDRLQAGRGRYPWLVLERNDELIAYAYASSHRTRQAYQWCVEVSIYVDQRAHRCGVGRALYTALFELLRRQRFVNAYAGITLPNPSSVGLHESLGFVPVGIYRGIGFKFDRWHDVAWLHLRLRDDPVPPADPLPVADVLREPDVLQRLDACAGSVRLS